MAFVIYNILIGGLCNVGKLTEAKELFYSLFAKGLQPNVQTYTIMIKGLCNGGLLDDASELLEKMDGNGCSPNDRTYNTIIRGLLQHNETSKAMKYLHKMVEKGLLANMQDLPNAMNAAEIIEKLRLHSRHQHHRYVNTLFLFLSHLLPYA